MAGKNGKDGKDQGATPPADPAAEPKEQKPDAPKDEGEGGAKRSYVALEIVDVKITGVSGAKAMIIGKDGFAGTREVKKWVGTKGKANTDYRCACIVGGIFQRTVEQIEKSALVERDV